MLSQKLAVLPYVSGIIAPIDIKNCGDDRLFVAERGGKIRIINPDGTLRTTPFLDISSKISSATESEEGFLGFAFSPDYKTDGKLYVDYTGYTGTQLTTFVEQYQVSASDSNMADPSSELTLLTQSQPFTNHNGGNLMFGKDGYLYINFGDGGSGGDPYGNGQNKKTFLGKILRIDVSNSLQAQPYTIPPANPFVNDTTAGVKKEIWIYGVRNPFRSSVDRITGDLLIADVGQNKVEEVDFQKANDPGGENYGWNIAEGDSCYAPATGCNKAGITMPIYEYYHNGGSAAIIGGYVYRGVQSKSLWGQYLFTDEILKFVDALPLVNGMVSGNVNHLITAAQATGNPVSFGEDKYGDEYIAFYGINTLYKLEDTSSLRRPKAYFTPVSPGGGLFLLQAVQGKNISYQWLRNDSLIAGAMSPDYTASQPGRYTLEVTNTAGFKDTSDAFLLGAYSNLTIFTAQEVPNNGVVLNWQTSGELNITGFAVQRRKDNETAFTNIGFVASKADSGFSSGELNYSFADSMLSDFVKAFYRLQIQFADGSFAYSDIRFISADNTKNGFIIFPNPSRNHLQLYVNDFTHPVIVSLFDIAGRKISAHALYQQNMVVDLPAAKGLYILQVAGTDGSNAVRKKVVVQ
ncbi:MAG TPA: PQQ-dependent sugar dehydrogenase [Chitinophagaceae bacterium]|nr:PQQ-dependent sugar dehydrogenase [Chitinophagaceae bacterium]